MHEIVGFLKFGDKIIGMTIDHKDNDPTNYSWDNLQLMTLSENSSKEENSYIHLTRVEVSQIKQLLREGRTQQSIADQFGVQRPLISKIKLGSRWKDVI